MDTVSIEDIGIIVSKIDSGEPLSDLQIEFALNHLEQKECWSPLVKLLTKQLESHNISYYVKLCKVYIKYLGDLEKAVGICVKVVSELKLDYRQFQKFLSTFLPDEDFKSEARILKGVYTSFNTLKDSEMALERLCLLYDKKLTNPDGVQEVCNLLLQINPLNIKALKFFKILYVQLGYWDKVCEVLKNMIRGSSSKQNIYRFAQELAGLYLYQLNRPKDAIKIIEEYCYNSPLDTSIMLFDGYKVQEDWSNCLKVLDSVLKEASTPSEQAVIHYRIAQVYENVGQAQNAEKEYSRAFKLDESFLDPLEGIINLKILVRDWVGLKIALMHLSECVKKEENRKNIMSVIDRLNSVAS